MTSEVAAEIFEIVECNIKINLTNDDNNACNMQKPNFLGSL